MDLCWTRWTQSLRLLSRTRLSHICFEFTLHPKAQTEGTDLRKFVSEGKDIKDPYRFPLHEKPSPT